MNITIREDGKWLCAWCATAGKFPIEEAWRPPEEEPIETSEGEGICHSCNKNYQEGTKARKAGKD